VHLQVTDEMAKDVKEINFGYNNDLSYESSHRGLSPFTVIGISMATASSRRRQAERLTRTTHLSLSDVTTADSSPDPIPTDYHGLVNLLKRYVTLLQKTVGQRCEHYLQVRRITAELNHRQQIFEGLMLRQIGSLVWQIFMDARRFFSSGTDVRGGLPQSLLMTTYSEVASGIVQAHLNVPYGQMISEQSDAGNENGAHERTPAGGTNNNTPVPRLFRHVPPTIKTSLAGARSKYPSITVAELMAAHDPPLQYSAVKMGPNGTCLDYLCFGSCKTTRCSYKHPAAASVAAPRAQVVATKLGAAYTAFDAAQT